MPQSKASVSTRQMTLTSQSLGSIAPASEDEHSSSSTETEVDQDYEMLMARIRQQNEEIRHLQTENKKLADELVQERTQGCQQLQELEAAAKLAEKQIQELSAELVRSRETGKRFQHLCETQAIRMHEESLRDPFEERRRLDMRLQHLELEAERLRGDLRFSTEERAKQKGVIGLAEEDRDAAQRLYEASERERLELKQRIGELSRRTRQQEAQLSLTAQDWLRKNRQLGLMKEDMKWSKIETQVSHRLDMGSRATYSLPKAAYLPKRLAHVLGGGTSSAGATGTAQERASPQAQQPPPPPSQLPQQQKQQVKQQQQQQQQQQQKSQPAASKKPVGPKS